MRLRSIVSDRLVTTLVTTIEQLTTAHTADETVVRDDIFSNQACRD